MSEEQDLIEDEELDLSTLPDDELVLQMHDDLYDGLKEEIEEGTNILLERGWAPDKRTKVRWAACWVRPAAKTYRARSRKSSTSSPTRC